MKEKEKMNSKPHLPEKKMPRDSMSKQPSLSELFRQQVRFFLGFSRCFLLKTLFFRYDWYIDTIATAL